MTIPPPFKRLGGFTLIEVLIAVAIVSILAAVAIPAYSEFVMRSHRSNARTALVGAAQWMERAATAQGAYPATADISTGITGLVEGGRYRVTGTVSLDRTTFVFTAAPEAGTPQTADKCGTFVIDNTGLKSVSGASLTAIECWAR